MGLSVATLVGGRTGISGQRGSEVWGANYMYAPSWLQNDIYAISDALKAIVVSGTASLATSGTAVIGSASSPIVASGIFMNGPGNVPYRLYVAENGAISGVAV